MPEINGRTLMMAIQAVDEKIHRLVAELDGDDTSEAGELELLLLSYEKTAAELKAGYQQAQAALSNLPPYETLVKD
jgi:hypothetical protein